MTPELLLELAFIVGAALILLTGESKDQAGLIVRASLIVVLCAAAIVVWALARYWS